jgi:hypothetical protein
MGALVIVERVVGAGVLWLATASTKIAAASWTVDEVEATIVGGGEFWGTSDA